MSTKSPKQVGTKLQKMISAWTKLRPAKQFAGMTVEQFNEKVKPSLDTREELTTLRSQTTDSRLNRHDADTASMELAQFVVSSVKGDPEEGENSGLYAEMGYTPKADRRSGLTRKGPTTPPVQTTTVKYPSVIQSKGRVFTRSGPLFFPGLPRGKWGSVPNQSGMD